MKLTILAALAMILVAVAASPPASAQVASDAFVTRSTNKEPDAVVAAIKAYSDEKKWLFLSANTIKNGEVRLVKLCIPEVGQILWAAGLQISALLPCGNIGIYKKGGETEISLLHARYMHRLYPHPATERASAVTQPMLDALLEAVVR